MDRELAQGRRERRAAPDDPQGLFLWAQQMVRRDRFAELFSFFLGQLEQSRELPERVLEWFLNFQEEIEGELERVDGAKQRSFLDGLMSSGVDASDFFYELYERGHWPDSYPVEEFCERYEIPVESLSTPGDLVALTKEAPIVVFTGLMSLLAGQQKGLVLRIIQSLKSPSSELKERFGRRRSLGETPKG